MINTSKSGSVEMRKRELEYEQYFVWIVLLSWFIFKQIERWILIISLNLLTYISDWCIIYVSVWYIFPFVAVGKRVFCHYFCWMAPFMVLRTKICRFSHLPGIYIKTSEKNRGISCGKCNNVCPKTILSYGMIERGKW